MYKPQIHNEYHVKDPQGEIGSRFYSRYVNATWFTKTDFVPMVSSEDNSGSKVSYVIDSKYDLLAASKLNITLPRLQSSSPDVLIAWPRDIFVHIIRRAVLMQENEEITSIDDFSGDLHYNFYETQDRRSMENEARGNVQELTGFQEILEEYELDFSQPWFYNLATHLSYPLLFNNKNNLTTHVYWFLRSLKDLLRVKEYKNDKWVEVPLEDRHLLGNSSSDKIPTPRLSGIYVKLTPAERSTYTSDCNEFKSRREIKFNEFVQLSKPNDFCTIGSTYNLDIKTKTPCYALFWAAENRNAFHLNNLGNYTIDSNFYTGKSPIIKYTIHYDNDEKSSSDSQHRCISQCRFHFNTKPCKNGFGVYSNAWSSGTLGQSDTGLFYGNVNSRLTLMINDPNASMKEQEQNCVTISKNVPFKIKVYALVAKKLSIVGSEGKFKIDKFQD